MSFLLAVACVVITILQRLAPQRDTPGAVRRALATWGLAYFSMVALRYGVLHPGGPGDFLPGQPGLQQGLAALLNGLAALLLWGSISTLAFHGIDRPGWKKLAAQCGLVFFLVAFTGAPAQVVGLLSLSFVGGYRWRDQVRPSVRALAWFVSLIALVGAIFSPSITTVVFPTEGVPLALQKFATTISGIAAAQALLLSTRLLSGRMIVIRSIGRRLALSHVLIGVVPLLLALIFWGVGSYVSVGTERAQSAARLIEAEAARLEQALAACAHGPAGALPDGVAARLAVRYPEVRVLAVGDSLRIGGPARPNWPDSLPSHGLVVIRGVGYLGAVDRAATPRLVAFQPLGDFVAAELSRPLDAQLRLRVNTRVTARNRGLQIGRFEADSLDTSTDDVLPDEPEPEPGADAAGKRPNRVSGAALVPVLRAGREGWQRDQVLLTAHVPWRQAAVGLITGIRENPFALVPIIILGLVALVLGVVENITVRMVVRMSRSVTAAVSALKQGTQALKAGRLDYRIPIRPEDRDELWDVAESFNTMAQGLEEARESERERERLEKELQLARQIQARLLPAAAPLVLGLDLAGLSFSAQEVGGDYYDFIPLPDGRVGLVIADVSGKGVPAALLMSAFRASLLSQALEGEEPGLLLERLNRFLHRSVEPGRFVTAFLGLLDPVNGRFHYANAGHNPPVIWREAGGAPVELMAGGFMLGAFAAGTWPSERVDLAPGDLLVLYTDGVTEAQDASGDFWGEERLHEFLAGHHEMECGPLAEAIVQRVREFEGTTGPSDDITLLLARRRRVPAARVAGQLEMAGATG